MIRWLIVKKLPAPLYALVRIRKIPSLMSLSRWSLFFYSLVTDFFYLPARNVTDFPSVSSDSRQVGKLKVSLFPIFIDGY